MKFCDRITIGNYSHYAVQGYSASNSYCRLLVNFSLSILVGGMTPKLTSTKFDLQALIITRNINKCSTQAVFWSDITRIDFTRHKMSK